MMQSVISLGIFRNMLSSTGGCGAVGGNRGLLATGLCVLAGLASLGVLVLVLLCDLVTGAVVWAGADFRSSSLTKGIVYGAE